MTKKKMVVIIHCWGGSARGCWRGWLADELRNTGFEVINPELPNTNTPKLEEWLVELKKQVENFDKTILIGHSLGCPTILRILEQLNGNEKVRAAIMVAGFAKDLGYPEIKNFVEKDFDWNRIKQKCNRFIIVNSDNDPFIPLEEGKRIAGKLNGELIIEHNAGHINEGGGWTRYQRILEIIKNMN